MKTGSALNVIMYLFRNHLSEAFKQNTAQKKLLPKLEEAGFLRNTIYSAFNWLNQLAQLSLDETSLRESSFRIYDQEEATLLDAECHGYLLTLEQYGILKPHLREKVIQQALALEEDIDTHLIKWITLLVLFAQPNEQNALAFMEHLVLNEPPTTLQ